MMIQKNRNIRKNKMEREKYEKKIKE